MKDWNEYIGKIYNHTILVIKSYKKKTNERNRQYFLCKCLRCGNFFETSAKDVLRKDSRAAKSCGCLKKEHMRRLGKATGKDHIKYAHQNRVQKWRHNSQKDGKAKPIYVNYVNMMTRCYNPNDICYNSYGEKGITVCEEWKDYDKYYEWAYANGYQDHYQAHRLDNDCGYFPENIVYLPATDHSYITQYMRKHNLTKTTREELFKILKAR